MKDFIIPALSILVPIVTNLVVVAFFFARLSSRVDEINKRVFDSSGRSQLKHKPDCEKDQKECRDRICRKLDEISSEFKEMIKNQADRIDRMSETIDDLKIRVHSGK